MNNVFEVLHLNLDDNAFLVDNLSTIPLTAAAFKLTSTDNRDRLSQGQLEEENLPRT